MKLDVASQWPDIRQRWTRLADPIHGLIQFDRQNPSHQLLLDVMNTQAFQRLRRIRQMGLAEFVFPGATHSRFIHSLGATHLMMRALIQLERMGSIQADETFEGIPLETLALLGILVHDIGHPPLSHTLEAVLGLKEKQALHEPYWQHRIITEDVELAAIWQRYHPGLPQILERFLGTEDDVKHPLALLISSQLDLDRLDYLQRDSHFLGVQYGRIEAERLMMNLEFAQNHDGKTIVAVREEALPAVEHYLFSRHQAYKMALHALDKASEALLSFTLKRFGHSVDTGVLTPGRAATLYQLMTNPHGLSVEDYLRFDDYSLWTLFQDWSLQSDDPHLQALSLRLLRHDLPKYVDLQKLGLAGPLSLYPQAWANLCQRYTNQGLDMAYGFDEVYVAPKPLYQPSGSREPIWIRTQRGVVDLREVSSLPLDPMPCRGDKHLVFVWDSAMRDQLRQDLPVR